MYGLLADLLSFFLSTFVKYSEFFFFFLCFSDTDFKQCQQGVFQKVMQMKLLVNLFTHNKHLYNVLYLLRKKIVLLKVYNLYYHIK